MSKTNYEVFISFKYSGKDGKPTRDAWLGEQIYNGFSAAGIKTFFSPVTLISVGADDYQRHIDEALDQAIVMIVIGTEQEYMESEWVRAEWQTFIGEVRGNRKQGRIFTYTEGMQVTDLPLPLRKFQMIVHGTTSIQTLLSFIQSSGEKDESIAESNLVPDKFFKHTGYQIAAGSFLALSLFIIFSWLWRPL